MELLIVIILIVLVVNSISINKKLNYLIGDNKPVSQAEEEDQVNTFEEAAAAAGTDGSLNQPHEPEPISDDVFKPALSEIPPPMPLTPSEPTMVEKKTSEFIEWLKKDWLAKSGALILLIGIGWFVSYAFAEGWVGEQGRITIGLVFGVLMMVLGHWRISKSTLQGGLLLIIGSSTVLTTIWAAQNLYYMFPPAAALAIMFLSIAFVAFVAVFYNKQSLATVALLLGFAAPLLTNSPDPSFSGLFSYLLIVVLGTIWVVIKTGWKPLTLISLIAVFFYSIPFAIDVPRDIAGIALLYAFVFSGIFTVVSNTTLIRTGKSPSLIDLSVISGVGLYLFTWVYAAAPAHWESLLYAAWAIVFAGVGYVAFRLTKDIKSFLVYAAIALAYVALATVATFDGPLLTVALTIEAALVPALVYALTKNQKLLIGLSLLLLVPVLLSLESLTTREWNYEVPLDHLTVLFVLAASLAALGRFTYQTGKEASDSTLSNWGVSQMALGSLYILALLWLIPRGLFSPDYDTGKLVSLVVYTIIGVTTYIVGHIKDRIKVRFVGGLLAALVILRLLFVEVWEMETGTRIITFMLVGFLLIATAFIEKKNKD